MNFIKKNLINVIHATKNQKIKEMWDVKGMINKQSNREFKFDLRPIHKLRNGKLGKEGSFSTKADKMVFENNKEWIIVDIEELHGYIIKNNLKIIKLEDIIEKLEWNIFLNKK